MEATRLKAGDVVKVPGTQDDFVTVFEAFRWTSSTVRVTYRWYGEEANLFFAVGSDVETAQGE